MFANRDKTEKLLKEIKLFTNDAKNFLKEKDENGVKQALTEISKVVNLALDEEGTLKKEFISAENDLSNALKNIKKIVNEL
jgi:hypothetical protein